VGYASHVSGRELGTSLGGSGLLDEWTSKYFTSVGFLLDFFK